MAIRLLEPSDDVTNDDQRRLTPEPVATDLDLVRRAQQHPAEFAVIFNRYHRDVFLYCFRRLADHDIADDAAATAFMKAYTAIGRFRPERDRAGITFRSWLFSIAHNVVIDVWRRERRHLSLDGPISIATRQQLLDPAASPEDHALGDEETRQVLALLGELPERQRAVVELRLAGLTTQEVATALGMSLPAAKSAQFRAYSTLRDLLRANPNAISREVPQ